MINTQYIKLNMNPSGVLPVLYCSQYDIGRPLGLVVYDSNTPVDLDTYTVTIEATRTDGVAITAAVTTDDNIGAFATTATMTNVADKYDAQLVLVDGDSNRVASIPFIMCVVPASMDENAQSIAEDASLYSQYTAATAALIAAIHEDIIEINNRIDWYVRPEDYGAAGDGTTDDTSALQQAITYGATNSIPVLLTGLYLITSTITCPSYTRIFSASSSETVPKIICGAALTGTALNCTGIVYNFRDFTLTNYENTYRDFDGIAFSGNSTYNVDATLDGVNFSYCDSAILIGGRNVMVTSCGFSHCRVGVDMSPLSSISTQIRGLTISNCRFHGVGEEAALNWFQNSYGILIEYNNSLCNVVVQNNMSDQGGCFFYGYATSLLIEGNFIESFQETPIQIVSSSAVTPTTYGEISIKNNFISGKSGAVSSTVTATVPSYLIEVENVNRVSIIGNTLKNCSTNAVKLSSCTRYSLIGNGVLYVGSAAFALDTCNGAIMDNYNQHSAVIDLCAVTADSTAAIGNNYRLDTPTSEYLETTFTWEYVLIGTIKANTVTDISLPREFFLTCGSIPNAFFPMYRYGSYYSSDVHFTSSTEYYVLRIEIASEGIMLHERLYTVGSSSSTGKAHTFNIYKRVG